MDIIILYKIAHEIQHLMMSFFVALDGGIFFFNTYAAEKGLLKIQGLH